MGIFTIDECTAGEIPETLKVLVQSVLSDYCDSDDNVKTSHLFVVLLCTLMMECGFSPHDQLEGPEYLLSFDVRRLRSLRRMPRGWWSEKESTYKLWFHVSPACDCSCALTVMPLSWTTVVNVVVPGETSLDQVINFPNQHRYVKSSSGDFADLRALSCQFKSLVAGVYGRLLADRGLDGAHLASMPSEILLSIARFLDHKSLARLLQTCRRLSEVCRDDTLWKPLALKTFGAELVNTNYDTSTWHTVFSSLMMKSISEFRRNRRLFGHNVGFD